MVGLALFGSHAVAKDVDQTKDMVVLQPEITYQSLEGWGSSLCWWAAQVGKWDEAKVDSIVDMLTSPDQLNLNHFLKVQQAYEEAGDIWEKLGQLNTHTYSGTNEERLHRVWP